jgi:hypothetical protein
MIGKSLVKDSYKLITESYLERSDDLKRDVWNSIMETDSFKVRTPQVFYNKTLNCLSLNNYLFKGLKKVSWVQLIAESMITDTMINETYTTVYETIWSRYNKLETSWKSFNTSQKISDDLFEMAQDWFALYYTNPFLLEQISGDLYNTCKDFESSLKNPDNFLTEEDGWFDKASSWVGDKIKKGGTWLKDNFSKLGSVLIAGLKKIFGIGLELLITAIIFPVKMGKELGTNWFNGLSSNMKSDSITDIAIGIFKTIFAVTPIGIMVDMVKNSSKVFAETKVLTKKVMDYLSKVLSSVNESLNIDDYQNRIKTQLVSLNEAFSDFLPQDTGEWIHFGVDLLGLIPAPFGPVIEVIHGLAYFVEGMIYQNTDPKSGKHWMAYMCGAITLTFGVMATGAGAAAAKKGLIAIGLEKLTKWCNELGIVKAFFKVVGETAIGRKAAGLFSRFIKEPVEWVMKKLGSIGSWAKTLFNALGGDKLVAKLTKLTAKIDTKIATSTVGKALKNRFVKTGVEMTGGILLVGALAKGLYDEIRDITKDLRVNLKSENFGSEKTALNKKSEYNTIIENSDNIVPLFSYNKKTKSFELGLTEAYELPQLKDEHITNIANIVKKSNISGEGDSNYGEKLKNIAFEIIPDKWKSMFSDLKWDNIKPGSTDFIDDLFNKFGKKTGLVKESFNFNKTGYNFLLEKLSDKEVVGLAQVYDELIAKPGMVFFDFYSKDKITNFKKINKIMADINDIETLKKLLENMKSNCDVLIQNGDALFDKSKVMISGKTSKKTDIKYLSKTELEKVSDNLDNILGGITDKTSLTDILEKLKVTGPTSDLAILRKNMLGIPNPTGSLLKDADFISKDYINKKNILKDTALDTEKVITKELLGGDYGDYKIKIPTEEKVATETAGKMDSEISEKTAKETEEAGEKVATETVEEAGEKVAFSAVETGEKTAAKVGKASEEVILSLDKPSLWARARTACKTFILNAWARIKKGPSGFWQWILTVGILFWIFADLCNVFWFDIKADEDDLYKKIIEKNGEWESGKDTSDYSELIGLIEKYIDNIEKPFGVVNQWSDAEKEALTEKKGKVLEILNNLTDSEKLSKDTIDSLKKSDKVTLIISELELIIKYQFINSIKIQIEDFINVLSGGNVPNPEPNPPGPEPEPEPNPEGKTKAELLKEWEVLVKDYLSKTLTPSEELKKVQEIFDLYETLVALPDITDSEKTELLADLEKVLAKFEKVDTSKLSKTELEAYNSLLALLKRTLKKPNTSPEPVDPDNPTGAKVLHKLEGVTIKGRRLSRKDKRNSEADTNDKVEFSAKDIEADAFNYSLPKPDDTAYKTDAIKIFTALKESSKNMDLGTNTKKALELGESDTKALKMLQIIWSVTETVDIKKENKTICQAYFVVNNHRGISFKTKFKKDIGKLNVLDKPLYKVISDEVVLVIIPLENSGASETSETE